MTLRLDISASDFKLRFEDFLDAKRETETDVNDVVTEILSAVRSRGDAALVEYTSKFDRFEPGVENLRISNDEVEKARDECSPETLAALNVAASRITAFHEKQLPDDLDFTDAEGLRLGYRWTPVGAVGLYVPGGTAAYPSSVLMNALPAKVAGVKR